MGKMDCGEENNKMKSVNSMTVSEYKREMCRSERRKWEDLFEKQLIQCRIIPWQRWFRFDPTRRWEVDFAWPQKMIIVEIEGGIWRKGGGAHSHPLNIIRDMEKYNRAAELGYKLFRFEGGKLKNLDAIKLIHRLVGTAPLTNLDI